MGLSPHLTTGHFNRTAARRWRGGLPTCVATPTAHTYNPIWSGLFPIPTVAVYPFLRPPFPVACFYSCVVPAQRCRYAAPATDPYRRWRGSYIPTRRRWRDGCCLCGQNANDYWTRCVQVLLYYRCLFEPHLVYAATRRTRTARFTGPDYPACLLATTLPTLPPPAASPAFACALHAAFGCRTLTLYLQLQRFVLAFAVIFLLAFTCDGQLILGFATTGACCGPQRPTTTALDGVPHGAEQLVLADGRLLD